MNRLNSGSPISAVVALAAVLVSLMEVVHPIISITFLLVGIILATATLIKRSKEYYYGEHPKHSR